MEGKGVIIKTNDILISSIPWYYGEQCLKYVLLQKHVCNFDVQRGTDRSHIES